jgi:hypothetical protein
MTTPANSSSSHLNPVQLHLLHLFSRPMTEKEMKELKMVLVEWYDQKAQTEMDKIWEERGMTNETMDEILKNRHRSPLK